MKKTGHKKRTILLLVLLAALCIGTAELVACRRFNPALYQMITAPIRRTAHAGAELLMEGAHRTGRALEAAARCAAEWMEGAVQASIATQEYLQDLMEQPPLSQQQPDSLPPSHEPDLPPSPGPALTELHTRGGRDILTGGIVDVVYFNQSEDPWASAPYGTDTLLKYGCGPTVMAMVVATLTDEQTDPALMAQWAAEHGHWASRSGSYHTIVSGAAKAYGLQVETPVEQTVESLRDSLLDGKLLVALVGPGHFTEVGHFILLRGITPDGDILVADPNSISNSLAVWDPQLILDELGGSNSSGAPLWAVSLPEP